ncbi:hypothetical protein [Acetanaerobacterium elongatum]|uniref:Lipoprotein n=1 Tax=Acetanaerobacterium elongatum TaxID=258515 RepID=A0A1H0GL00_9FIRM|nr:hypothetical protein [Acetanaerobacterium elongatum]SDO07646.1 hypothetical protein SAMN05192585_1527 [Acetanaerobacterium elongatum]
MKKGIVLSVTAILSALLLLAACAKTPPESPGSSAVSSAAVLGESLVSSALQTTDAEKAYYLLFEKLWQEDDGLNDGIQYISLDLTRVKLKDTAPLVRLVKDFCDKNGYELLCLTFEQLKEQGYIEDLYFDKGVLFSFEDKELTADSLKTDGKKWRSGLGAIGATYTVEKKSDGWAITGAEGTWIS